MVSASLREIREALRSSSYISGYSHSFYRYPARFSPTFARTVISNFSRKGDTVLDPFVGGGTSVIEALTLGRRAIGVDLNSLAIFVTRVKTTHLSSSDKQNIRNWASIVSQIRQSAVGVEPTFGELSKDVPLRLQRIIAFGIHTANSLTPSAQRFIRTVLLRVGQWALDNRQHIPSVGQFSTAIKTQTKAMLDGHERFVLQIKETGTLLPSKLTSARRLFNRDAASLLPNNIPASWRRPNLVLTSPPYMGVHVLYNKWQVKGRRETRFPYAISGTPDGHFGSYYTFGDRKREPENYLSHLIRSYSAIRRLVTPRALVVQLVSFNNPTFQLPKFLTAMTQAGFEEELPPSGRRIWRPVPNRKWYIRTRERSASPSREVLLIHRCSS